VEVGGAEDGERGADGGAEEIVACQDGRDVARVAVGKVAVEGRQQCVSCVFFRYVEGTKKKGEEGRENLLEYSLEEEERAAGKEGRSDDGHYPVNTCRGCPAEHEERDREEDSTDHSYRQTVLRDEVWGENEDW
jgi:hypothetical protein